ncbi:MAG1360 family OppF-related protein [Mycoplasmopsis primatum]|uniref:MAG1360 family OppF-related protein n=1 Tax=Mycoplasmopsis primatum TaxID=55604 RepID=UPI000690A40E|nr:hypothetical protein [Mycoplasmopsis primatum]
MTRNNNKEKIALNIDSCFYRQNKNKQDVDIKKIKIFDGEKVIFLVNDKSLSFFNDNFWDILKNNPNQLVSCFAQSRSTPTIKKYLKHKKTLEKINFFNLSTVDSAYKNISLLEQFSILDHNHKISNSVMNLIQKALNKYEFIIKTYIFDLLKQKVNEFYNFFVDFEKEQQSYIKKIELNLKNKNYIKANTELQKYRLIQEKLITNVLTLIIDINKNFWDRFSFFTQTIADNVDYLGQNKLALLQEQYNFMKKIKDPTMIDVKKALVIRDKYKGIKILNEILIEIKTNAKEEIKYLIDKYRHLHKNDLLKANNFRKTTPQHQFLIKKSFVERHIYKLIKSSKNKLRFLTSEEIDNMNHNLNVELKLFINNNLSSLNYAQKTFSYKSIIREIEENFDFSLDSYESSSSNREKNIKENIKENLESINEIKDKFFKVKDDFKFERIVMDIQNNITKLQGEIKFNLQSSKREFDTLVSSHKKVIVDFDKITEKFNRVLSRIKQMPTFWNYLKLGILPHHIQKDSNLYIFHKELEEIKQLFLLFAKIFKKFAFTKTLLFNSGLYTKKIISDYYLFSSFIEIFNKSSIHIEDLAKPIKKVSYINKAKMAFIGQLVNKPRLVIIEDDISKNDINLKKELIRVIGELSSFKKSSFVFITNDKRLLDEKFFDYSFLFVNNKEVEHGEISQILRSPFNPIVKANLQNLKTPDNSEQTSDYVFSDEIYIGNNHYLITTLKHFKNWTIDKKQDETVDVKNLVADEREQEKTLSTQIENLESPLMDAETMITDLVAKPSAKNKQSQSSNKIYDGYLKDNSKAADKPLKK